MSNLIINWRFGRWFFQVERFSDWRNRDGWSRRYGNKPVRLTRHQRPRSSGEPLVELYQGKGYAVLLAVLIAALVWWIV